MTAHRKRNLDDQSMFELLEEEIGTAAVTTLCRLKGGTTVHFPREKLTLDHWLAAAIGYEAAKRACKLVAGRMVMPKGIDLQRRKFMPEVLRLSQEGWSAPKIAQHLDVHERTVYRYRRGIVEKLRRVHGKTAAKLIKQGIRTDKIAEKLHLHPWNADQLVRVVKEELRRQRNA